MPKVRFDPRVLIDLAFLLGTGVSMYYLFSNVLSQVGDSKSSAEAKKKANASLQRLQARNPELQLDLDEYEQVIVTNVVTPAEIKVHFKGTFSYHMVKWQRFLWGLCKLTKQILEVSKTLWTN